MPSTVKDRETFKESMLMAQDSYNQLIADGENVEDARNVLPLNIYSTITMRTDMAQVKRILSQRLCLTAQEEWRTVAYLMKAQVLEKMGSHMASLLQPPCHAMYGGKCNRERFYCGVPLMLDSTNPKEFARWMITTGGKPDGSKIPTNTVILQDDLSAETRAHMKDFGAGLTKMSREELDAVMPGKGLAPAYVTPKPWTEQQAEKEAVK